jgi:pimeloyl-ACP methyl ester carboxylesterase
MDVCFHGEGEPILFVHGSAADATSWSVQRATLASRFRVVTYDRVDAGVDSYSVGQHADDAARIIEQHGLAPCVAVGSSFGGVVALELARRRPSLLRGAVLCEPPLAPADDAPVTPNDFRDELERRYREHGGPSAAAFFLRTVLGERAFNEMPVRFRERACELHEQIRLDSDALLAYRPRYASMSEVVLPVLLLGGDRSAPYFAPTLAALAAALPNARRKTLRGGTHMMHADAARQFNSAVTEFVEAL